MGVAQSIDRIKRDFLWGGVSPSVNSTWLTGNCLYTIFKQFNGYPKSSAVKQALLGKREALWQRVEDRKYGSMRGGW